MSAEPTIFLRLMHVIEDRRSHRPPNSYTTQLLDGGVDAIAAKLREETGELIEAARTASTSRQEIVHEAADRQ